jgi:hypothetical protein
MHVEFIYSFEEWWFRITCEKSVERGPLVEMFTALGIPLAPVPAPYVVSRGLTNAQLVEARMRLGKVEVVNRGSRHPRIRRSDDPVD